MLKNILAIIVLYVGLRLMKKGWDNFQDQDIYLAKTIWGEARGEGAQGMQAVGNVVLNRVKRGGWYGASIKDVVLRKNQFSCWNENDVNRAKIDKLSLEDLEDSGALGIARKLISGELPDITKGATEYHRIDITPNWDWSKLEKTVTIGNHVFYRSK